MTKTGDRKQGPGTLTEVIWNRNNQLAFYGEPRKSKRSHLARLCLGAFPAEGRQYTGEPGSSAVPRASSPAHLPLFVSLPLCYARFFNRNN